MAKTTQNNVESEREEGEIVDELSDISSEEEYLLRQRLQVLESYNNVLERKKAKRSYFKGRVVYNANDTGEPYLSEISTTEFDENLMKSPVKRKSLYHKERRKKIYPSYEHNNPHKVKVLMKKKHHRLKDKKKLHTKVISESSDEEDIAMKNKKIKLANAVLIKKGKLDKTSLKARLMKMFTNKSESLNKNLELKKTSIPAETIDNQVHDSVPHAPEQLLNNLVNEPVGNENLVESIDLCNDDDDCIELKNNVDSLNDLPSSKPMELNEFIELKEIEMPRSNSDGDIEMLQEHALNELKDIQRPRSDSDEDIEMLRQHALKSKCSKPEAESIEQTENIQSEDEDSDTKELRLICLKSAFLKKAIEMKRKQKLQKRLSHSSNLGEELLKSTELPKSDCDNNTDIESVDMDTGVSDGPELDNDQIQHVFMEDDILQAGDNIHVQINNQERHVELMPKEDEYEEDEDLLRAKLLTSLSKKLPKLTSDSVKEETNVPDITSETNVKNINIELNTVTEEKRFIINTKDSDSGSDTEATKNLTKMHNKLVPLDFQQRLDLFLKSTRMIVENSGKSDSVQQSAIEEVQNTQEKFVPKAVNHLPKSEQLEYKTLVKRMAELQKLKEARQQSVVNMKEMTAVNVKETLKPRNVVIQPRMGTTNLEDQITLSRKKIAEESAKLLKLKEDGTKLLQKYKIVETELRNLSTAITLNKRQVRVAQTKLTKIRTQHQNLLKRSSSSVYKSMASTAAVMKQNAKGVLISKTQKENAPYNESNNTVKVSIVNDFKEQKSTAEQNLSVQLDCSNNKKVVKMRNENAQSATKHFVETNEKCDIGNRIQGENGRKKKLEPSNKEIRRVDNKFIGSNEPGEINQIIGYTYNRKKCTDDYQSPLAILSATWDQDPNGVLCPFDVGGVCRDPSCRFLHHQPPPPPPPLTHP